MYCKVQERTVQRKQTAVMTAVMVAYILLLLWYTTAKNNTAAITSCQLLLLLLLLVLTCYQCGYSHYDTLHAVVYTATIAC
jgi:hypothetical protein